MNEHPKMTAPTAPFKPIDFLPREIDAERRANGEIILRQRIPLNEYQRCIPLYLAKWAEERPDQTWLAQRRGPDRAWKRVSYAQAKRDVDAVTQALIDMKLTPEQPVAILSGNSIEHALMTQAAMQAGVPAAPVSPAYSLMSQDHAKLRYIFDLIKPGLVMVQDGVAFGKALKALDLTGVTVVHVDRAPEGIPSIAWSDLVATKRTDAVDRTLAAVGPKSVGKLLFTSGSTGMPKAVINTQEMMCANVVMGQMTRKRKESDPRMVVLDWLPWNHTMGGNAGFHALLAEGGTLYIDDGRPVPGMFDETLRNLKEISPTYYTNVPAGFAVLATALENDDALAKSFFKDLGILGYGGATLPDDLYTRMQRLAVKYTGHRIVFFTGWGSTETAPTATSTYWETERVGLIGLPHPGVELKMVPAGPKYEMRIRSVIVTPGYYRQPDLTAKAFDEEGYYKIGDAGTFVDADEPAKGLIFAGRVVEDFKLTSGTFVHVGSLRVAAIAAASPVIQDALVAGQDREFVALLAWPNLEACRLVAGKVDAPLSDLVHDPAIKAHLQKSLHTHNAQSQGSSMRIARVMLMTEPPSIDGNELTDKGYINQRAALERRNALVERLYAQSPDEDVIVVEG
ncbi:MAG: AMP-binding protein [Methylobacteriaceae bacterium]|nr:AMP-binding protein [Methylobacteriaceae bacterium]